MGTNSKNRMKSILKISAYNTLENLPKSRNNNNIYKKQCSTQEQIQNNLQMNNNNIINKKVLSLKFNKK